jgi:peptidyl-dipeptidase Dcp
VELFEIYDKKNKEKISEIAFDLFPRDGKHPGAFKMSLYLGFYDFKRERYDKSSIVVSCNFRKDSKTVPSLLSFNDMETLFHEFGHALHGALSKSKIPSQFGTSVK